VGAIAGVSLAYALATPTFAQPAPAPAPDSGSGSGVAAPDPVEAFIPTPEQAAAETIEIVDTAPAESASSVHLTLDDLRYRSRTQVSDLLRNVPGLMVSQHAGGGKSDQYFIRGFDADHGTDIAIFADGVPVNMPSHGHGQGYADTHFLIPETIKTIDVHKGPYSARFGDFYTAGAMELSTLDRIDGPTVWVSGGAPLAGPRALASYNRRLVGMASPELRADDRSLIAVEVGDTDGPFENPQHFRQGNALVKWQGEVMHGDLELETNWYQAKWNASGQLPASAVASGLVDRFGSLDPSEGGDTGRTSGQLGYILRDDHGGTWRASAFLLEYRLKLFSNFTLYARDPVHGDEIEQDDARTTWGLDAAYDRHFDLGGHDTYLTVGAQNRNDDVDNGLWHVQQRARLGDCFAGANPCNHTQDHIRNSAVYAEANIHFQPHIHVLPGIRFDQFVWDVDDLVPAGTAGGTAGATMTSPKLSVEIEATPKLDVFANFGTGFHSNDARGNVASGGTGSLARAIGGEGGIRTSYVPHAKFAVDAWYLHLASELVWSGDEGGTDASSPTHRYGVDLEGEYTPRPWLRLDANASIARAELDATGASRGIAFIANAGNGGAVALAPRLMGQGGITLLRGTSFVSLRARGIADRPGNDTNTLTAEGYLIFDLVAGTRPVKQLSVDVTLNNLFDTPWREAQFADTSAVTPASTPIEQMHFTPGIPLTATVTAAYQF
jgi:outer membrane receptor protein involved in Fe transport